MSINFVEKQTIKYNDKICNKNLTGVATVRIQTT